MSPSDSARDDLAYLRALVDTPANFQRSFGEAYFAAGLCYGVQMLLHAAQSLGWIGPDGPVGLAIGLGPTVVFIILLTWIIARERASGRGLAGTAAKAISAMLGAIGVANLVLLVVVGVIAWREQSLLVWLIYPCTVLTLQGTAWLVIYAVWRRTWFALVALGWYAAAAGGAIAAAFEQMAAFIAIGGVAFLTCMLIPGWVMMRQGKPA
jgi:hypothetical protein